MAKFEWAKLTLGLIWASPRDKTDSPEGPLPVLSGYLFIVSKLSEMGELKCPHPRDPLRGTPTDQIGRREMIAQCVPYTAPVFVDAHFKEKGENRRPLTPMAV